jgi:hypothetical protein
MRESDATHALCVDLLLIGAEHACCVAVGRLLSSTARTQLVEFKSECALMARCSNHPNVIKFIGTRVCLCLLVLVMTESL